MRLDLDGQRIAWHQDRLNQWRRGERFAPIMIDMALTRACDYACEYCYSKLQANEGYRITRTVMERFLRDAAALGVKSIVYMSDGESTLSPAFDYAVHRTAELGMAVAVATNGRHWSAIRIARLIPVLTYVRVNFSGGTPERYATIMGTDAAAFDDVSSNVRRMMEVNTWRQAAGPGLSSTTIGMQMVVMPRYADDIIPTVRHCLSLQPDYIVLKHCADDHDGALGIDYGAYESLESVLREAEAMSTDGTRVHVRWNKIREGHRRRYDRCLGPPFMLQISGSGLVAPCGMLFNSRFARYHMGNICTQSFRDIIESDRYWAVMEMLADPDRFSISGTCGICCLQDRINLRLWEEQCEAKRITQPSGTPPPHVAYL